MQSYSNANTNGQCGFRKIDVELKRRTFATFPPLPNFACGYRGTKNIETAEMIRSVIIRKVAHLTFDGGHHDGQIAEACMGSSRLQWWVSTPGPV